MANHLIVVNSKSDILLQHRQIPIQVEVSEYLYQIARYNKTQDVIGKCIGNRKSLQLL